jgi:hypothetical protein
MKYEWCTHDFHAAVVMVTAGIPIKRLEGEGNKRVRFVFDRDERVSKILDSYLKQTLVLPAHKLLANLKFLKTRITEFR